MKPTDQPPHGHGHGPRGAQGDHDENPAVVHEESDVNVSAIATGAGVVAGVVAVSMVAMYLLFGWFDHNALARDPAISPLAVPPTEMPRTTAESPFFGPAALDGVQLLTNEPMALERHRAAERERLEGYGWVDEGTGVARIPIEEAKRLIVERGLPAREFEVAEPTLGTRLQATGESSGGRMITGALPHPAEDAAEELAPGDADTPEAGGQPQGEQPAATPATPAKPGAH